MSFSSDEDVTSSRFEKERDDPIGKYEGGRNKLLQRHGFGRALLPNGDYYEGEYRNNTRHGKGLYVKPDGSRYNGEYRNGNKEGTGTCYYPDGTRYEGEWRNNLKHGLGVYYYKNGDTFRGVWFKGKKHGEGIYFYDQHNVKLRGTFKGDELDGAVQIEYPNNAVYHGHLNSDKMPTGKGIYSFSNLNSMQFGTNIKMDTQSVDNHNGSSDLVEDTSKETIKTNNKIKSIWCPYDIVEYDTKHLPHLNKTERLPETPTVSSEQSVSIIDINSDMVNSGAWSHNEFSFSEEEERIEDLYNDDTFDEHVWNNY